MANIPQPHLIDWDKIENLGDLNRLKLVLDNIPDEKLMQKLEQERGNGRNDYPVRAMWNSLLAMVVYQHTSIESLRRELLRNAQLRSMCGFDPLSGEKAVPDSWCYSRFFRKLFCHWQEIREMFLLLVRLLSEELPGFGSNLAMDGKMIRSHGKQSSKSKRDGRRELDANWGIKTYKGTHKDGRSWEKTVRCFGFRLHLLIDADYELPVNFSVTPAANSELKQVIPLVEDYLALLKEFVEEPEHFIADKGYDDGKLHKLLWEEHGIKAVIPVRKLWKDGEESKLVGEYENLVYDYEGKVSCVDMLGGEPHEMAYGGFEKARGCQKYRCPAKHYGYKCGYESECSLGKAVRIPIETDRRIFTPLARGSHMWDKLYKKRSAVERVNSRLDVSFCFEEHFIRGLSKMQFRLGLAFVVMQSMALGHVKAGRDHLIRSLVKAS